MKPQCYHSSGSHSRSGIWNSKTLHAATGNKKRNGECHRLIPRLSSPCFFPHPHTHLLVARRQTKPTPTHTRPEITKPGLHNAQNVCMRSWGCSAALAQGFGFSAPVTHLLHGCATSTQLRTVLLLGLYLVATWWSSRGRQGRHVLDSADCPRHTPALPDRPLTTTAPQPDLGKLVASQGRVLPTHTSA